MAKRRTVCGLSCVQRLTVLFGVGDREWCGFIHQGGRDAVSLPVPLDTCAYIPVKRCHDLLDALQRLS